MPVDEFLDRGPEIRKRAGGAIEACAAACWSECDFEFVTVTGRPTYENNIRRRAAARCSSSLAAAPDSAEEGKREKLKKEGEDF